MNDRAALGAGLVAVFLLGGVCGAGASRALDTRYQMTIFDTAKRGRHGMLLWSLEQKLSLSAQQREEIEKVLLSHEPEMRAATQPCEGQARGLRDRTRAEIRARLTPPQQADYDQLMTRYDESRNQPPASSR